ncbi:AAA family ATPase [Burkholderia multivorans]|uniref:AAA family ATPase n=1 Tax=Burkholderia multivorans TaxID=87883 RepID=UPI0012DE0DDD|nr:AAA family ATPase [Burkholderia multivorans]MBU9341718.1 AAA family ATPase [Burkholderia multivorans]MCA8140153.1 AAA family ATPase [Burkholderia multivorans]QGR60591.1 AAA family ATPase [Burkholderia multivorans]
MPISQQVTNSLNIKKLKGISFLDEIRFDEKPLTAILGPNGCGKSTILHALACCYKPPQGENQQNWQFRHFFTPTPDATWAGSSLEMVHTYREGANEFPNVRTEYRKNADRWSPRYANRPERHLRFIGIKSCVPRIEEESYSSAITYQTEVHADADLIMTRMQAVFNRAYSELNIHRVHGRRRYPGLALDGTRYSALAMGAGEQRVLEILSAVFNAPRYGLILIDEIDLLLHTAALTQLIRILFERATEKSLQIVFTTHREAILELKDQVSIKHIHTVRTVPPVAVPPAIVPPPAVQLKTYCFSNTKPDALRRLTGQQDRPLEIFVEDEMALAIVEYELFRLGMKRVANVTPYGAATNCFTLAAGLILSGRHNVNTQLFLLDGDLYVTPAEQLTRANAVLSGTEAYAVARRQRCLDGIRKLCAQAGAPAAPEAQLHRMIRNLPRQQNDGDNEIIDLAVGIEAVDDTHSFIELIVRTLNVLRPVGLSAIVKVAALSPIWDLYVTELREWLVARRLGLIDDAGAAAPAAV